MPTAGIHITIVERIALTGEFSDSIGEIDADQDSDPGKLLKFAKLGAIGPDIFYALADYKSDMQDLINFLSKLAGSVACITELTADIDKKIAEIEADVTLGASTYFKQALAEFESVFGLINAILHEGLMAAVVTNGVNFFPIFEARRQQDKPRKKWFWADYLHYVRTGQFARELFVQSMNKPNVRAFACGYLTHYVTDVVGHPFVNQIVGAPYRMYWQRHHLVENFMDGYIWDRWHDSIDQTDPNTGEQFLDKIRSAPNAKMGDGARFTFARLNDHINVGTFAGDDPIDKFIQGICDDIRNGLENIGVVEKVPDAPDDEDLNEWAETLAQVFKVAYPVTAEPPENLKGGGRPDGYPTADDIKQAYSLLRLFLRVSTEESINEPEFPDIVGDVWNAVKKLWDDVEKDLGAAPPFPSPGIPQSMEDLWAALKAFLDWAAKTAAAIGKAAFDFIKNAIAAGGVLLVDMIKAGLYLIKKALFDLYKYLRFFLVRTGYAIPFTDELTEDLGGGIPATTLWRTAPEPNIYAFPKEELPDLERKMVSSHYVPWVPPEMLSEMQSPNSVVMEQPQTWMGPYASSATPDAFIDPPVGTRTMLSPQGPTSFGSLVTPGVPFPAPTTFGGAIDNSVVALRKVLAAESAGNIPDDIFPDYNLDGDRGYGWPCWNVRHPPGGAGAFDSLQPSPGMSVTVDPVLIR
ncbi:zinc dependent phospholipase C family protein [Bradyrhizobium sp. th.b2]|uniref:zinc dependent phospholipase C family protein n=1 Tax=Bradyrhizobium sp. th-b2 TaxID=172088 RepID=UPI0004028BC7|nr:zinc dependent phospholipase C family protein [Bradyrhizobium sp. th.b2]